MSCREKTDTNKTDYNGRPKGEGMRKVKQMLEDKQVELQGRTGGKKLL